MKNSYRGLNSNPTEIGNETVFVLESNKPTQNATIQKFYQFLSYEILLAWENNSIHLQERNKIGKWSQTEQRFLICSEKWIGM